MGAAAAPTAGGAVAMPTARGGAPERTDKHGAARRQRGGVLDALAADGGVGRERVALSPGSVSFGDGDEFGEARPTLPSDPGCDLTRSVATEWQLSAQGSVAQSMSWLVSASLDQVVSVGTSLLRRF